MSGLPRILPRLLKRYLVPVSGPVSVAASQFLLTLLILRSSAPEQFGQFSLLLVATQLAIALGGALFCAPLASLMASEIKHERLASSLQFSNLLFSSAIGLGSALFALLMNLSFPALLGVGGYAMAAQLRSFGRAQAYAEQAAARSAASDLTYAISLLPFGFLAQQSTRWGLESAFLGMLCATCLAMVSLPKQLFSVPRDPIANLLRVYHFEVWRPHARWSALGVLTTELTANCHVYIVSLASGPASFAPLAASAIFIRPLTVLSNALTEFERAQIADAVRIGDRMRVRNAMYLFRCILWVAWLVTCAGTLSVLYSHPAALFRPGYDLGLISFASALWLIVAAIRNMRMAEGTLLQACGRFDALANASVKACGVSVLAVTFALLIWEPVTSISGLALGEAVYALIIWTFARKVVRSHVEVRQ